jgi:MFS family permease
MIRKLLLATLFILQISILPSWGADTVLIDRLTTSEAEEFNIEIPTEVPPGYHEVIVEISDDAGVVDKKVLTFCKDINGNIDWASNCPDLEKIFSAEELSSLTEREEFPSYDPAQEPEKTKDLAIAAFAVLATLSAAGASAAGQNSNSNSESSEKDKESTEDNQGESDSEDKEQDDLSSISAGDLDKVNREPGKGDLSNTWRSPGSTTSDALFAGLVTGISRHLPLFARTLADGTYLRAMFGSLAPLTIIPAAFLGVMSVIDTSGQALPPALWIVMGIIALANLDAFAGFVAGLIFTLGVAISGNLSSRDEILTVAGLYIIFYAPALLASAIRPLRRLTSDRDETWERATDYALALLLTGWTMSKLIGGLNALAGIQLLITFHANQIAWWTAVFVLVRLVLEDFATYNYPKRIDAVSGEFKSQDTIHKVISLELKIFIFIQLAMPFIGFNLKLFLGTLIMAAPTIIGLTVGKKFPKTSILYRLMPSGAFKIVAMVFIGTFAATFIQGLFANPRTFLEWAFVALAIPGLILSILGKMVKEPESDWKKSPIGNTAYRILGVLVFLLLIQIVRGVDLYAAVFGK